MDLFIHSLMDSIILLFINLWIQKLIDLKNDEFKDSWINDFKICGFMN